MARVQMRLDPERRKAILNGRRYCHLNRPKAVVGDTFRTNGTVYEITEVRMVELSAGRRYYIHNFVELVEEE